MLKSSSSIISASQIATPITLPGDVTLSTGNLVIGTSGKGIDFSATSGTGTSELLSDYEEGTWTPVVTSSTGTITTVGDVSGTYIKVGSQVTVWASIAITANGSGGGAIVFSGLPFVNSAVRKTGVGWNQNTALTLAAFVNNLNTTGGVRRYDAAYPVTTGESFVFTVTYSV
jgi:hypothetical protein